MAAPIQVNVLNVTCTVSGYQPTFNLSWVAGDGQAGALYQIQLYTGTTASPMQTPVGTPTKATPSLNGTWVYSKQVSGGTGLAQYVPYWLAVQAVNSSGAILGPPSDPVLAIFVAVPLVSVATNDRTVVLQWSRTATQAYQVDGFMVQINDANSALWQTANLPYPGYYSTASGAAAQTASFKIDFPLDMAAQPLTLSFFPYAQTAKVGQVSNVVAFSQGPVAQNNFYTVVPKIVSAVNALATPTQYALTLPNTFGAATPPTLKAAVFAGDSAVTGAALSQTAISGQLVTTTLTLPKTPTAVANGAPLVVSLTQTDSGATPIATGPVGLPHVLLTASPLVAGGSYTPPATANAPGNLALNILYPPESKQTGAAWATIQDSTGATVFGPSAVVGNSVQLQPTLAANASYRVILQSMAGADAGPAAAAVSFPTSPAVLVSASYDGSVVKTAWTAPAGATPVGYQLRAVAGSQTIASVEIAGLNGALTAAAPASGFSAQVAPFISRELFGPAATVPLVTQAPAAQSVIANPATGYMTLTWGAVSSLTTYVIQLYRNGAPSGAPIAATGTSYSWTSAFSNDGDYAVAVAATKTTTIAGQTSTVAVTGPYGPLRSLPTAIPVIIDTTFQGSAATVAWREVTGATGYKISVLVQGSTSAAISSATAPAGSSALSFSVAITDTSKVYVAVVQALFGPDVGAPSAQAPLFKPGYFLAPGGAAAAAAVYPASVIALPMQTSLVNVAAKSSTITSYLPALADSSVVVGAVTAAGPFSLVPNTGTGSANYPFTLSIAGGSASEAWAFDSNAIRPQLQADYIQFLKNLEIAKVSPYGVLLVQQAIARMMPQTFAETLYYAYGFNTDPTAGGSIDLRPGLVLRVSADPYQYVNNAGSGSADNAFTGGATLDLDIASYLASGAWKLGFDSFFAQLVAADALTVTAPKFDTSSFAEQPVADAADLFFPLFKQSFYRLFAPSALQSPWTTGSNLPASNFAIAAATSFTNLTTANNLTGNTATLAYFGGRAVIRACVRITVNEAEIVAPVGTTVGNILDRLGKRPPSTALQVRGFELRRSVSPVVLNPSAPYDVGQSYAVRFDWNSLPVYGYANDALNLPVLHGDVLTAIAD